MGLRAAAPELLGPRDGSKSAMGSVRTAPMAPREASRRPRPWERSRSPRNGCQTALGAFGTASRPLREPRNGFKSSLRGLRMASGALREPSERLRRSRWLLWERLGCFEQASSSSSSEYNRKCYSKKLCGSTQLETASFGRASSVHVMHGFTLVYIYIL